jgi:hypothetical protein
MTNPRLRDSDLWHKLRDSTTISEVLDVITVIHTGHTGGNISRDHYEILVEAFRMLQRLTVDDPVSGRQLILEYVLPHASDPVLTADSEYLMSQVRDCLAEWIYQYSSPKREEIRDQILDRLLVRLRASKPQNACWAVVHIGYRREDISNSLRKIVDRYPGKTGDVALHVIAWLTPDIEELEWVLASVHGRMAARWSDRLASVVTRIADPRSLDALWGSWLHPGTGLLANNTSKNMLQYTLSLRALTEIADRHPENGRLQPEIWKRIVDLVNTQPKHYLRDVLLGSDVTSRCNTRGVVPSMFAWMTEVKEQGTNPVWVRYLIYKRLSDCVKPEQLQGWKGARMSQYLTLLRQDACLNTALIGRVPTEETYVKREAWDTVLRARQPAALSLDWFHGSVLNETNLFIRADIMDRLACFRLLPIPEQVIQWITEEFDSGKQEDQLVSDGELFVRQGAIEIARSATTDQAFNALLNLGLTFNGQVLINSADALADVAITLLHSDQSTPIIGELIAKALQAPKVAQRIAAVGALDRLAARELVPGDSGALLESLLFDQELPDYIQSTVVGMLGILPNYRLGAHARQQISDWARNSEDARSIKSLEALAYQHYLLEDPGLVEDRLGLKRANDTFILSSETLREGTSGLVGLLYHLYPKLFQDTVATLLSSFGPRDWSESIDLITLLSHHHIRSRSRAPAHVKQELIAFAFRSQSSVMADTYIFSAISHIAPDALASERWQDAWGNWLPDARAALAEALGRTRFRRSDLREASVELLRLLMEDGQFAIRRAAYRSLARQAPAVFASTAIGWSSSPDLEVRERSAEACEWLDNGPVFITLSVSLLHDPEKSVRDTIERSLTQRRERLWVKRYLSRVLAAKDNQSVLEAWAYGEAITRLGDDAAAEQLEAASVSQSRPLHTRHWYKKLAEKLRDRWRDVTRKWPEPWELLTGRIEYGNGVLRIEPNETKDVQYTVWRQAPDDRGLQSWGGSLLVLDGPPSGFLSNSVEEFTLQLSDGSQGRILAGHQEYTLGQGTTAMTFTGQGKYPSSSSS